jgi:hypothetical protein
MRYYSAAMLSDELAPSLSGPMIFGSAETLQAFLPAEYPQIRERWLRLLPDHPALEEKTASRIEHWYHWTKAERGRGIIPVLESLDLRRLARCSKSAKEEVKLCSPPDEFEGLVSGCIDPALGVMSAHTWAETPRARS